MRSLTLLLVLVSMLTAHDVGAQTCGIKPIPHIGCKVGQCVGGKWEQVCNQFPTLTCGIKPTPHIGCKIGQCVDGAWEQVCNQFPTLTCGIKPIPHILCRIGRCIDGEWEQVCNQDDNQDDDTPSCGIKPIAHLGCRIGKCVNGAWEQVCRQDDHTSSCGIKPILRLGCRIGGCVDGEWKQVCSTPSESEGDTNFIRGFREGTTQDEDPSDISVGMPRDLVLRGLIARYAFAKVDLTKLDLPADLPPFEVWIAVERTTRETWRITFQDGIVVSVAKR